MATVGYTAENKAAEIDYKYPKLWLDRGEVARIIVGLENPQMEYVHNLEKPIVINGQLQMETKQGKNGPYEAVKTKFVTKAICLGDASALEDSGADPKNCPMCKLAADKPDQAKPPYRRYATHVVRYKTQTPSTFNLQEPFNVETLVWSFPDRTFNKLIDFATEHGDLRQKDLLLGPCESKDWQKFDIQIGSKAEWLLDESRKQRVVETFRNNQIKDLTVAIGSPKKANWIVQDIKQVTDAWAEVNGTAVEPGWATDTTSLDTDLSSLLNDTPASLPSAEATSAPSVDPLAGFDDLFAATATTEPEPAPVVVADEPVAPPVATAAPAVDNFDDLLAGL